MVQVRVLRWAPSSVATWRDDSAWGARAVAWQVILEGTVYDLAAFAKVHPGGGNILNIFGGSDATTHYYMLHQHAQLRTAALAPFKLRTAEPAPPHSSAAQGDTTFLINSEAFRDLKQRVRKGIPYQFATWEWYAKAVAIMAGNIYLEYLIYTGGPALWKHATLGFFMALVGLAIQHDANHGGVSDKGWVNRLWGYTQDWIGGSALLWRHHHVLMHHAGVCLCFCVLCVYVCLHCEA